MDPGLQQAIRQPVLNPLPKTWLGYSTAPPSLPDWANIGILTNNQVRGLQAQIGYDASAWNYQLIGSNNQLGRYQVTSTTLETYGLLVSGANAQYGSSCVNYQHCWTPGIAIKSSTNAYNQYIYNTTNLTNFLKNTVAQEHLSYQILSDCYTGLVKLNAITSSDTYDVAAGMMYVAWVLGIGSAPTATVPFGLGAYAWRYSGIGDGDKYYNNGRYAVTTLLQ
jgi:hypothetical protein